MPTTKVYTLKVRPLRSADLAFNTQGALRNRSEASFLGSQIQACLDLRNKVFANLGKTDENGRLQMDSSAINKILSEYSLYNLSNESEAAVLDQAIIKRHNAFLEKYKFNEQRLEIIRKIYPVSDDDLTGERFEGSRTNRILKQIQIDKDRFAELITAYNSTIDTPAQPGDGIDKTKVVTRQVTNLSGSTYTTHNYTVRSATSTTPVNTVTEQQTTLHQSADGKTQSQMVVPQVFSKLIDSSNNYITNDYESEIAETIYPDVTGATSGQLNTTLLSEFLHPYLDTKLRHEKYQNELQQELLSDSLASISVHNLIAIWDNELRLLDLDVARCQIEFLKTFLIAPFPGIVTSVYKEVGENVQSGESVLRIEDNSSLLLVGLVSHRGLIRVGTKAKLTITNLFENDQRLEIDEAKVVSIRGHDSDNHVWDIIIQCINPLSLQNQGLIPINYNFDRDSISISFMND